MRTIAIIASTAGTRGGAVSRHFSSATVLDRHILYRKLASVGRNGSAKKVLNDSIMDGYFPRKYDLVGCAKELRKYNQHHTALEIFQWLERRKIQLGMYDHAVYLDLIAKTKGVREAETYFENLPPPLKNTMTYGTLLNTYCKEQMVDKAVILFEKMDELNLLTLPVPFCNMMSMYLKIGNPQKVIDLVDKMRAREIPLDYFTYTMRIQSYSLSNDIESLEKAVEEMKADNVESDWSTFANLASIYIKFGIPKRAEAALRTLESQMPPNNREAYHFLVSSYAKLMKPEEVNRLWMAIKSNMQKLTNNTYCALIAAISKVGDVEGLKECVKEWESSCSYYDVKVANLAIKGLLENGEYEEGEHLFERAVERCDKVVYSGRLLLCCAALKRNDVGAAMEHFERALSECRDGGLEWRPKKEIMELFFGYFEKERDAGGVEKFCEILMGANLMDSDAEACLERVCRASGKLDDECVK